jgi:MFS family permease
LLRLTPHYPALPECGKKACGQKECMQNVYKTRIEEKEEKMVEETRSKVSAFGTLAILSISLMYMAVGSLIAPALNAMGKDFADTSFTIVKLTMTSSFLTIAVFSLISGVLAKRFQRKYIAAAGLLIYGVFGIAGGLLDNVFGIIACRLVQGAGCGLFLAQATAIIIDLYKGAVRDRLLGYSTAIASVGSMLGSIIAGFLVADYGWQSVFYPFGITILLAVLVMAGVPKTEIIKADTAPDGTKSGGVSEKKHLPRFIIVLGIGIYITMIYALNTPTNMAVFYLTDIKGDPALLGITMALITGTCALAGFVLSGIRKIFKDFTPFLGALLTGGGFVLMSFATTVPVAMIANAIIGVGYGIVLPCVFIKNAQIVTPAQRSITTAILSCCMYLGNFSSPFAQDLIGLILGPGQRTMFLGFGVIAFVVAAVVLLYLILRKSKKGSQNAELSE